MRILTRYLLRAHLGPFIFSLSVLTGLLLINTVARRFQDLAGKGLPLSVITEVFILSIPYTLALTLPMSVLVAVLYVFSQLTADNEITALKASGVSLVRLLMPLLAVAAVLTGGMIWFNDKVLPEANHRLRNLLVDIGRKSPTLELQEQVINEIRAGDQRSRYYLQVAKIEPIDNRLFDIVIYDLSTTGRDRTIYADSGRMALNADRTDLYLTLYDGWIYQRDTRQPERFVRMFYDEQVIRMAGVGNVLERDSTNAYRGDREMSVAMLAKEIADRRKELEDVRTQAQRYVLIAVDYALRGPRARAGDPLQPRPIIPAEFLDPTRFAPSTGITVLDPAQGAAGDQISKQLAAELRSLKVRMEAAQIGMNRHRVELHKKYAIPFACIVFVLIGAPLALRFPRGGVGMVIAFSLVIFSIYWIGLTGGENLGDKGIISPMAAMWAINVVFLTLGVWAFSRLGKEASTTRGGGWDDLFYTLRTAAARGIAVVMRRRPA